ncbi:MAG: hypothetical protein HZB13_00630 [Acidobacteria bacterium]|nr:hypothetical protein [Acidobacteriota bacterium]
MTKIFDALIRAGGEAGRGDDLPRLAVQEGGVVPREDGLGGGQRQCGEEEQGDCLPAESER